MADNNYLHTAEIMKAALPYVDTRTKTTMNFFSNMLEFMSSYNSFITSSDLAACGYENQTINFEGLLTEIRPLCNDKERELVDQFMNIFNAKQMYETYSSYMSAMKAMQGFEGFPFGSSDTDTDGEATSNNTSNFDFSSIFGNEFNNMNSGTDNHHDSNEEDDTPDNSYGDQEVNAASTDDSDNDVPHSGNSGNNNMLEMLKTMIPPEQMSTFENLSMLLNTMSYDDNRNHDDNKE